MVFEPRQLVTYEKRGDINFVKLQVSQITETSDAERISKILLDLAKRVGGKFVLDLSRVKFMRSCGISVIVGFNKALRQTSGGKLKICGISPLMDKIFSSTGLNAILEIYPTEEDAVRAFKEK